MSAEGVHFTKGPRAVLPIWDRWSVTDQPIVPVATAITAFVGAAPTGPVGAARLVTSMSHFARIFGGLSRESHLGYSVRDYFRNGGRVAVIVRVAPEADLTHAQLGGLHALRDLGRTDYFDDPVALVVVPPAGADDHGWVGPTLDVLRETVTTAEEIGALALLDAPAAWGPDLGLGDGSAGALESLRSTYAAMYFPQLVETDPLTGRSITLAPSGAVAGVIARTDAQYGPWSVAAGTGTSALDVDGLTVSLDLPHTEALAALGINAIRAFPGTGPIVWGARLLARDPDWRYVTTRRTALFLEHSIERGLQWTSSEPNGEPLWARVRGRVEDFLHLLFTAGAFPGTQPQEAYFVRCDASTMTESDLADGTLRLLVGFASVRPAEFVLLRIALPVAPGS